MADLNPLADSIAQRFIARPDVKAIQKRVSNGNIIYKPHENSQGERLPWKRADLIDHLESVRSYGHYMLSKTDQCKLFALDIDLCTVDPTKPDVKYYYPVPGEHPDKHTLVELDPRKAWRDRSHPSRSWTKYQFRFLAGKFCQLIHDELEIPTAAAYTGNKGIHVYGFTGLMDAYDVRLAAELVLEKAALFVLDKGNSFYKSDNLDPVDGFPNLSLELFPKQASLGDHERGLGNLMRLPLGKNLKAPDPCFFIDLADTDMSQLKPSDALWSLTTGAVNPWSSSE